MATTIRAQRIREQVNHFNRLATTFEQKVLCLRVLLGMRYLGRPTRRWVQKQILVLQSELLSDPADQTKRQELLEQLLERNEIATKKNETRAANKAAKPTPAAAPAASEGGKEWDL